MDSSVVGYDGDHDDVRGKEQALNQRTDSAQQTKQSRWGFRGMTVRNWLELLIIPLALVGIGILFEMQQADRQRLMEQQQQDLEQRRAKAERELAKQRAQDEALQAYLDEMGNLMLEHNLLETKADDPVYTLAQARTSTIINRLDAERNRSVMRFLTDSGLTGSSKPSVSVLRGIQLADAELSGAFLEDADMKKADLVRADLSGAYLIAADLSGAYLGGINITEFLAGQNNPRGADLSNATLAFADLSDADLRNANLSGAILFRTDFTDANLEGANLTDAHEISNEDIERQAASLEGATMLNGQKYEEWRKDH